MPIARYVEYPTKSRMKSTAIRLVAWPDALFGLAEGDTTRGVQGHISYS